MRYWNQSERHELRKFMSGAAAFVILFFVLDRVIGYGLHFCSKLTSGESRKLEWLFEGKLNADLLVIGSSRASVDIIPRVIQDVTGISGFNLGFQASNTEFHEFLLSLYLKHNPPPRYILKVVDPYEFELRPPFMLYFRLDVFYPFIDRPEMRRLLIERGDLNPHFTFLKSFLYQQGFSILRTFQKNHQGEISHGEPGLDGYIESEDKWHVDRGAPVYQQEEYDIKKENPVLRSSLLKIMRDARACGARVVFVFPPHLLKITDLTKKRIMELAGKDAVYLDYSSFSSDKRLFVNETHLSMEGARLLSVAIGKDLLKLFSHPPSH